MRAKEYIEQNKSSINHLDEVKRIIDELLPLRMSKEKTDEYYNNVLSADIRLRNYLLQKELYEKKNAMQLEEPSFVEIPNEIPTDHISEIRETLFQVIRTDESFGYLFFLLGTEQNAKHKSEPIDCIPNAERIKNAIGKNRDDYPKATLDDYLDDDFNYKHYDSLISENQYPDDQSILLEHFNKAYLIYDELRCRKHKISEVRQYCNELDFTSEKEQYFQLQFVISMIEHYESNDDQLNRVKKELQKKIEPLQNKFAPQNDESSEETKEASSKVQSAVILELLKKMNCGKAVNDLSAICRLIAFLTGKSYSKIYNEVQKGISLSSYHSKEIEQANKILSDLNTNISINKDKQY